MRFKLSQQLSVIGLQGELLQREVRLVLELMYSGLLALIAHFAQAATESLALIVHATDGNICALTVTLAAELALTGLSSDSCELSHSLGVLKVIV